MDVPLHIYTAIGAAIAWSKLGRDEIRPYIMAEAMDYFFIAEPDSLKRRVTEMAIFVLIGVIAADALIDPSTESQAIAAGLGWTAMLSGPPHSRNN